MIKMQYYMNDGSLPTLDAIRIKSKAFDGLGIQISEVLDYNKMEINNNGTVTIETRFVYEEIDRDDSILYCHYISRASVECLYSWFFKEEP